MPTTKQNGMEKMTWGYNKSTTKAIGKVCVVAKLWKGGIAIHAHYFGENVSPRACRYAQMQTHTHTHT